MALEDSVDRQYLSTWDEFVVGEHQIWYMLQNNFENIHTYTAMYCFSPSGNAHEKVEHVNHWFILQINSSWIIGRSNGETFTPEARVWGRCDTLYHVTRSLIEHHSITWLFLGGCITLHYITLHYNKHHCNRSLFPVLVLHMNTTAATSGIHISYENRLTTAT